MPETPAIGFPQGPIHAQLTAWCRWVLELEHCAVTKDQCAMLEAERDRLHGQIATLKQQRDELEAAAATRQTEAEAAANVAMKELADAQAQASRELEGIRQEIDVARGQLASVQAERAKLRSSINAILG